jgi:Protein of unknown function (DUF2510)
VTRTLEPGWYQDPQDTTQQKYFDGQHWTENVKPTDHATVPDSPDESVRRLFGMTPEQWARNDELYTEADAAGLHGDVSALLIGAHAEFGRWAITVRTFEIFLRWAGNHSQPIVAVRYELSSELPQAWRRSLRYALHFRDLDNRLLAAIDGFVYRESWAPERGRAISESTPGLLNLDSYQRPLGAVELECPMLPGQVIDPSDAPMSLLEGVPNRVHAALRSARLRQVSDLLSADLTPVPDLTDADITLLAAELSYLGFR